MGVHVEMQFNQSTPSASARILEGANWQSQWRRLITQRRAARVLTASLRVTPVGQASQARQEGTTGRLNPQSRQRATPSIGQTRERYLQARRMHQRGSATRRNPIGTLILVLTETATNPFAVFVQDGVLRYSFCVGTNHHDPTGKSCC